MKTRRLGDHGDDVGLLQRRLIRAGYPVQVTHLYDAATEAAVIALQRNTGLVDDGIAGPKTCAALATGRRDPTHLALADLERAARTLDVPLACIRAVNEVESRGAGFLPDGRPVIPFERHVFWKRLQARGIDPAPFAARQPDIVSRTRGGYRGGAAEYTRLATAESIDAGAAWESASWGAFQVMGYHWRVSAMPASTNSSRAWKAANPGISTPSSVTSRPTTRCAAHSATASGPHSHAHTTAPTTRRTSTT